MEEYGNAAIQSALGIQRTLGAGPPVDSRIVDTQVPRVQQHGTVSPRYPPVQHPKIWRANCSNGNKHPNWKSMECRASQSLWAMVWLSSGVNFDVGPIPSANLSPPKPNGMCGSSGPVSLLLLILPGKHRDPSHCCYIWATTSYSSNLSLCKKRAGSTLPNESELPVPAPAYYLHPQYMDVIPNIIFNYD